MRHRLIAASVLCGLSATAVASAAPPLTLLLAKANAFGKVTLSTPTTQLRGRVWLYRVGGTGVARASAAVSCQTKTREVVTGSDESFKFGIKPGGRQEVWRYLGGACTITVSVEGRGRLNLELRGS